MIAGLMRRVVFALVCWAGALFPGLAEAHPLPGAPNCSILPADNPWNQRVDRLPVARDSARLIASIGLSDPVHPDFGTVYNGAPNGIPFAVVSNRTRLVPVSLQYADESDGHLYPLPPNVPIEGGPSGFYPPMGLRWGCACA
jgi:hypothetical protein